MLRDVVGDGARDQSGLVVLGSPPLASPSEGEREEEEEDLLAQLEPDSEEEEGVRPPQGRKPRYGTEISVKQARKVLEKSGDYPDTIIEQTIALMDPTNSGVITIVDFYDTLQKKKKAPFRRSRDKTRTQRQRDSFPRGLVCESGPQI
jgi:hypothetical protein